MLHLCTATLTLCGFVLRGYWMIAEATLLERRWVRIAPHVIDTVFLLSGIGLIFTMRLDFWQQPWLQAKLAALVVYILFGTVALKRGRTQHARIAALVLALLTFAYIVGVALSKSTASWLALSAA